MRGDLVQTAACRHPPPWAADRSPGPGRSTRSIGASSRCCRRTAASRSARSPAKLGVAEATVRARYGRLVEDDVLQVIGITNPLGLGFDAQALLGVNTAGASEPVADEISSWIESSYVVIAAGRFDVLAEVLCVDRRHLLELTNRVRAIPGVVSTETFPYLQLAKQVYGWGMHLDDEAGDRRPHERRRSPRERDEEVRRGRSPSTTCRSRSRAASSTRCSARRAAARRRRCA